MKITPKTQKKSEHVAVRKINQKIKDYKMGAHAYDYRNPHEKETKTKKKQLYFIRTLYMLLAAFLFNFGVVVFLQKSETIPSGLSGIPMLISLIFPSAQPWFAVMYLACNVPLFLIFGWRIKKSFSLHTLEFMLFQILINFLLTYEFSSSFGSISGLFHKVFNVAPGWEKVIILDGVVYENPTTWPILANGLIGSAFIGTSIALAWKFGGSTGGTDIIGYYFSTTKQRSIGVVLSSIALVTSMIFLIIFAIVKPHNLSIEHVYTASEKGSYAVTYKPTQSRVYFGMREVTSFVYIGVVNGLVSLLYPKYKKVNLEISCSGKFDVVLNYFKDIDYWHAYSIYEIKSGYTGEKVYKLKTTMLLLEAKNIIKDLKQLHPTIWISVSPVTKTFGLFNTHFVDED
ncbi:YitT family protein [Mycoplasma simbae]|uniref:YitT family protein n=1 Tax=Mycoplasma simbae TaxID=36744 RepID=UPI0004964F49|nr:YitT family protein [Mycoplasma simbae]